MLTDILADLERLKQRLQQEIDASPSRGTGGEGIDASVGGERLAALERENADLRAQLENDLSHDTLTTVTEQLTRERATARELREQIKGLKDRLNQSELISPEEAAGLVNELARLSDERSHQATEIQRLQTEVDNLVWAHAQEVEALIQRARAAEEMAERPAPPAQGDAAEPTAAQRELQRLAFEDPVTGLPKFELGRRFLAQQLEQATRGQGTVSLVVIDIDQLRSLNLHLGYDSGSQLVAQIALRLRACLKSDDVVVRGQDDDLWFVTSIPTRGPLGLKSSSQRATSTLGAFIESLKAPFEVGGHKMQVTVGCGVLTSQGGESAEVAQERAMLALKAAKREGRNGAVVYQPELERLRKKGTELLPQLRQALDEDQLCMRFQPIYDLKSRQIWGAESLIRWNHPRRGLLLPGEFLDAACETGVMIQIGEWALKEACRVSRTLSFPLSFNVSAQELMQADFVRKLTRAIEQAQARPESLILEVSESSLVGENDRLGAALKEVRRWGVQLAIDDFTFDTLSMGRLRHWNVSYLKLGAPLVDSIDADRGRGLAQTAIVGAASLGCKVIAEAISNQRQLDILLELGCQLGQGDYLCPASLPGVLEEKTSFRKEGPTRPGP